MSEALASVVSLPYVFVSRLIRLRFPNSRMLSLDSASRVLRRLGAPKVGELDNVVQAHEDVPALRGTIIIVVSNIVTIITCWY